jgi:cytochrome b6-f complex iron-sulfur subunit
MMYVKYSQPNIPEYSKNPFRTIRVIRVKNSLSVLHPVYNMVLERSLSVNELSMQDKQASPPTQPLLVVKEAVDVSKTGLSRRNFLDLAWKSLLAASGLLGLGGLARYLAYKTGPSLPTQFDLGPADQFAPGTRTPIPEAQAILLRDQGGFLALSLVCPHLGCQVNPEESGFACPCHGSQFGDIGQLKRGPATSGLRELRLETSEDGHLILHTN